MFRGTDNIPGNIPSIQTESEKHKECSLEYLSVPQNTIMDLSNVMYVNV